VSHPGTVVARHSWAELSPGLRVTISGGLVARRHESTVDTLLQRADACLYRAKHLGRNRVMTCRQASADPA